MKVYSVKICDYEGCTILATFSQKESAEQMVRDIEGEPPRRGIVMNELDVDIDSYLNRQYVWEVYRDWSYEELEPVPSRDRNDYTLDKVSKDLVYVKATTAKEAYEKAKLLFKVKK